MMTFVLERPRRSPLLALQSIFIHAAIVCGALWATRAVASVVTDPVPTEVSLNWTPVSHVDPGPVGIGTHAAIPLIERLPIDLPPLDPVKIGSAPIDPRHLVSALPGMLGTDSLPPGGISASSIYQESQVDDLPVLVSAPAPRFPRVMAETGIDGSVTLSFVIDAEGRVLAQSVKVIRVTHEAFIAAAEEAVYASLFRPAKVRGEGVPVLVRQTVSFRH